MTPTTAFLVGSQGFPKNRKGPSWRPYWCSSTPSPHLQRRRPRPRVGKAMDHPPKSWRVDNNQVHHPQRTPSHRNPTTHYCSARRTGVRWRRFHNRRHRVRLSPLGRTTTGGQRTRCGWNKNLRQLGVVTVRLRMPRVVALGLMVLHRMPRGDQGAAREAITDKNGEIEAVKSGLDASTP